MFEASGAPFDQGVAQGSELVREVRDAAASLRSRYGGLAWREALWRARRRPGRTLQRFLPQQHERLRGIALGAEVSPRVLELFEELPQVRGVGRAKGTELEGHLDLAASVEAGLALRHSRPDAVGFPSVELVCAASAGCLAGVNDQGVAAIVIEERGFGAPPLRAYAQDLLLRAQNLAAGVDHLRLRARYGGGSGALLALDTSGAALRLELDRGALHALELPGTGSLAAEATVRIDVATRALVWRDPQGEERVATLPD